MSFHNVKDPDELVTCVYDESHRVARRRLPRHLIKCRANYPNSKIKICSHNSDHHIPVNEYDDHLAECPDRHIFDKIVIAEANKSVTDMVVPPHENKHVSQATEDWEAECRAYAGAVGGYDQSEQARRVTFINPSVLAGKTKSGKKEFLRALYDSVGNENEEDAKSTPADATIGKAPLLSLGALLSKEAVKVDLFVKGKQQDHKQNPVDECTSRFEQLKAMAIGRSRGRAQPLPPSSVQEVGQIRQASSSELH